MNKSIVWPCLAAASLLLAGCGGGEPAADGEPSAAAGKNKGKGEMDEPNPWASEGAAGSAPAEAPKQKGKTSDKPDEVKNPWAKEMPTPAPN